MDETRLLLDTINQLEVDCTAVDRQRTGCIPYSEFVFLLLKNGSSRAQADRFVKVFGVQNPNHNEKNRNAWEVNYREMIAYIRKQQNLPERRQDSLSKRSTTTGRSSSTADSPFRRSTTNPNTNHIHINNTNYETVPRTPSRSKSTIERSEDRVLPNRSNNNNNECRNGGSPLPRNPSNDANNNDNEYSSFIPIPKRQMSPNNNFVQMVLYNAKKNSVNNNNNNNNSHHPRSKSKDNDLPVDTTFIRSRNPSSDPYVVYHNTVDITNHTNTSRKEQSTLDRSLSYQEEGLLSLKEVFTHLLTMLHADNNLKGELLPIDFLLSQLLEICNHPNTVVTLEELECIADSFQDIHNNDNNPLLFVNYTDFCLFVSRLRAPVIRQVRDPSSWQGEVVEKKVSPPKKKKVVNNNNKPIREQNLSNSNERSTKKGKERMFQPDERRKENPYHLDLTQLSNESTENDFKNKYNDMVRKNQNSNTPKSVRISFSNNKYVSQSEKQFAEEKRQQNKKEVRMGRHDQSPSEVFDIHTSSFHSSQVTPSSSAVPISEETMRLLPIVHILKQLNPHDSNIAYSKLLSYCTQKDYNQSGFVHMKYIKKGFQLLSPALFSMENVNDGTENDVEAYNEIIQNCILERNYVVKQMQHDPLFVPYVELVGDLVICDNYYKIFKE